MLHPPSVDSPEYVDGRNLAAIRQRHKATGSVTGAMTHHPLAFPLTASTRTSTNGTRRPPGEEERPFSMSCSVTNYEDVQVHAGTFAAFRFDCDSTDGFAEYWYAPSVKNVVKSRWAAKRESFSSELWDYELAK